MGDKNMQTQLNVDQFTKYFFYGLENKDEIVKAIIVNVARQRVGTHNSLDENTEKMNYEIDSECMLNLIVQLERFTTLHDDPNNRHYFYQDLDINSQSVNQMFNKNLKQLSERGAIVPCRYRPLSGIYYAERKPHWDGQFTGEEMYNFLKSNSGWAQEEVYGILVHLEELEQNNKFQYYSLFMDSKYARAIDRYQRGITNDESEKREILKIYKEFLR